MTELPPTRPEDALYLASIADYGAVARRWVSALEQLDLHLTSLESIETPVRIEAQLVIPYGPEPEEFKRGITVGRYFRKDGVIIVQMTPEDDQTPSVHALLDLLSEGLDAAEAALKRRGGPAQLPSLRALLAELRENFAEPNAGLGAHPEN